MFMRWSVTLLLVVGCHHDKTTERDTKGRATATISGNTVEAGAFVAAPTRPDLSSLANEVVITWPGTIRASTGKAPAVGTACSLSTRLVRSLTDTAPYYYKNTYYNLLTCGAQTLYDNNVTQTGLAQMDYVLQEHSVAGKVLVFEYALKASDVGPRTGERNQFTVSTDDGELIAFREISPTFRVTIALASLQRVRRTGQPMYESNVPQFLDVVKSKATLTSSSGALPFTGKVCELRFSPGGTIHNCRVQLECNAKIVFGVGTTGFEDCTLQGGEPVGMSDTLPTYEDHDPKLTVDMMAKTAILGDVDKAGVSYTASFTLE